MVSRFIDIAVNLTDDMYQGYYHGKKHHDTDIEVVLERASASGAEKIIITGTTLADSVKAIEMCKMYREQGVLAPAAGKPNRRYPDLYCTVGIHPTQCSDFQGDEENISEAAAEHNSLIIEQLRRVIADGLLAKCVVAVGEIGLDFDRLEFCPKTKQMVGFREQLQLAKEFDLPVFFHNRNSTADFVTVLEGFLKETGYYTVPSDSSVVTVRSGYRGKCRSVGVVHSFTGTDEELAMVLGVGSGAGSGTSAAQPALYVGINGCSLKTTEGLEAVRGIPLHRLLLETDAPWCGVKNTHASKELLPPSADPTALAAMAPVAPLLPPELAPLWSDTGRWAETVAADYARQYDVLVAYPVKKSDRLNKPSPVPAAPKTKGWKGGGNKMKTVSGVEAAISMAEGTAGAAPLATSPALPAPPTDGPDTSAWCFVKDRSEPCHILHINHIVAAVHNVRPWELASVVLENTNRLFFPEGH
jgi:TatD DNase family protein